MKRNLSDRARLVLVALTFTVVIAAVILATAIFIPERYVSGMIQRHWIRFGGATVFLFAVLLRVYWNARKSFGFWIMFSGFLVVHCAGVGHLWSVYNGFSTLVLALFGSAEWVFMALVFHWVTGIEPRLRPWRSRSRWVPTF